MANHDSYAKVLEAEDCADLVTFTSSSTVNNFCNLVDVPELRKKFPKLKFVSIGPVTTKTAEERGLVVVAEAEIHTIPGLVEAILKLK